jgi:hypothetical protein
MNSRGIKLSLISIATAAVVAAGFIFATQALAISGTLSVSSANLTPGSSGSVNVTANVSSDPGLGAWTVDVIIATPSQVSVVDCTAVAGSVCNAHYASNKVRFAGAVSTGLLGSHSLGTITVRCASTEGSSLLNLDTVGFADATIGGPVEIAATFSPGTVTCHAAAAGATSTPVVSAPPVTGTGASDGGYSLGWLMTGLAALGVAGLAGFGALRVRSRRV